jgi:aminopeptidase-like protein
MTTGINGQKHAHLGLMKSMMPHGITGLERVKHHIMTLQQSRDAVPYILDLGTTLTWQSV